MSDPATPQRAERITEAKPPPPRARRRIGRYVVLLVLLGLVVVGATRAVRAVRRPPAVLVTAARIEDVSRMLAVTGRIEAMHTVVVSPQFAGRITEIVRYEGERVKQGETLARLADTSARSEVLQQEAARSSKEQDLAQAQRDLTRAAALVQSGASPASELEAARLAVARATEELRGLSAVLKASRSQLVLLAPFDGTIVRRDGELGQVVGPQSAVFEVASVDAARVSAQVDERYVRALRPGMRAEIIPFGAEDTRLPASVSYVARAVEPQTGAATVRFAFERAPAELLIGMSVDVNVSIEQISGAVTIPREAVGGRGDRPFVLVVAEGRVVRRAVTLDDWPAPRVVVRAGLAKGELVLLDPKGASAGARVRTEVAPDVL